MTCCGANAVTPPPGMVRFCREGVVEVLSRSFFSLLNFFCRWGGTLKRKRKKKGRKNVICDGRESNPGQLLGRQLCSPLYHQRSVGEDDFLSLLIRCSELLNLAFAGGLYSVSLLNKLTLQLPLRTLK